MGDAFSAPFILSCSKMFLGLGYSSIPIWWFADSKLVRPSLDALTKVLMVVLGIHLLALVTPFLSLFSLFAYLLQVILLMFLFHLPPYLTNRAIELINQAFEVSAGSIQVFFVWTWNCNTKCKLKVQSPSLWSVNWKHFLPKVTIKTRQIRHIFHRNFQVSL